MYPVSVTKLSSRLHVSTCVREYRTLLRTCIRRHVDGYKLLVRDTCRRLHVSSVNAALCRVYTSATSCAQQVARNLMLVARNKLRWCKRGISVSYSHSEGRWLQRSCRLPVITRFKCGNDCCFRPLITSDGTQVI